MSGKIQNSRTVARGVHWADVPRSVRFTRRLFLVNAVAAVVYTSLAMVQLNHLAAGRVVAVAEIGPHPVNRVAESFQDLIIHAIVINVLAIATMLPFALLVRRARHWARIAMIAVCVAVVALVVILISADGSTVQTGNVFAAEGFRPEAAEHFRSLLITSWFPLVHYVAESLMLVTAIGGLVGLAGSDTREYFRRHQEVADNDHRLWSVVQARQREKVNATLGRLARDGAASVTSIVPSPGVGETDHAWPVPVVVGRAA